MPSRPALSLGDDGNGGVGEPAPREDGPEGTHSPSARDVPAASEASEASVAETGSLPAAWLDRLLSLSQELTGDLGQSAVVARSVAALEQLLEGVKVAVLLPEASPSAQVRAEHRHVLWTEPPKSDERVKTARAFHDCPYERSVELRGPTGATVGALHFAADTDLFPADESPHSQLLDRAAGVVSLALDRAAAESRILALETELRTAEAQMVQAEKLASLGQIAAGMVHELNNPLTSIAAYTDFLLRRSVSRENTDPDDVERLRRIAESANRMLRFTRDLVSYARPSGDVPIAVAIHEVIERALAFCEHEIAGVGIVVARSFDLEIGPVRGLPEQLAQVFVNLITNACHAMALENAPAAAPRVGQTLLEAGPQGAAPEGGEAAVPASRAQVLTISTARQEGPSPDELRVTVVVADTGCGISKVNLDLIFNPFFTTKGAGRGTGLGLSIVKNIVTGHGGEIRAESDHAYGTRFILAFPAEPGPRQGPGPESKGTQ